MFINKKNFTIIELITVCAIIGIMVTLLLPSVYNSREMARLSVCMGSQRQIGIAAKLYANNSRGLMVGDYDMDPSTMFFAAKYLPYMGGDEYSSVLNGQGTLSYHRMDAAFAKIDAYQCPSAKHEEVALDFTVNSIDGPRYNKIQEGGQHGIVDPERLYKPIQAHRTMSFNVDLSEVAYVMEINNERAYDIKDKPVIDENLQNSTGRHYHLWDVWGPDTFTYNESGAPNSVANSRTLHYSDPQHLGKMNINFFDGHSKIVNRKSPIDFAILNPWLRD